MTLDTPIIQVILPFFTAFAVSLTGLKTKRLALPLTLIALTLSLLASIATLQQVLTQGTLHYQLGGWPPPIGIVYVIDPLNALVLIVIATVALLTALFSNQNVTQELPEKAPHFYTLYLLLVTGLQGITITGDAFNLYVLLEISSLTSYALIALGRTRAAVSSFNYIMMGSIGASFYLLGVGYLYIKTGSLNMADIRRLIFENGLYASETIMIAFIFILVGIWIKMAFFPLHDWLPNAYTFAPSSTSCLLAPLMTKVSVYVMIRMIFSVFSVDYVFNTLNWRNVVVFFAVVAIIAGSLFALAQVNLKKMLAYLIVAEVGYMVGGVWLANANGLSGAIFHIISDALMTLCLFLAAGVIYHKTHGYRFESLKGLFKKMPITMAAFTVGALSMIGIPPTCGFFSKWYLISGGIEAGQWAYVAALLFSSLINAILFFRIIEFAYFEKPRRATTGVVHHTDELHSESEHIHVSIDEAPISMLIPLSTVAICLIAVGVFSAPIMFIIEQFVNGTGL